MKKALAYFGLRITVRYNNRSDLNGLVGNVWNFIFQPINSNAYIWNYYYSGIISGYIFSTKYTFKYCGKK